MEVVVSACNDTKTVSEIKKILESHESAKLIVYEKCGSKEYNNIPLANVGREQHTFAHHIAQNYDSLSDRIICTAGNFDKHPNRRQFLMDALTDATSNFSCNTNYAGQASTLSGHANFTIDSHEGVPLHRASTRPLSEWSKQHIRAFDANLGSCYEGMFRTSSAAIHKRPQTDYANVAKKLSASSDLKAARHAVRG